MYEPGVEQRLLRGRSAPGHREMVDGNRSGRHRCRECRQRVRREEAVPLVRAECNFTSVTVATQSPDSATGWSELRLRQGAPHRPVSPPQPRARSVRNELSGGRNERTNFLSRWVPLGSAIRVAGRELGCGQVAALRVEATEVAADVGVLERLRRRRDARARRWVVLATERDDVPGQVGGKP